MIVQVSLQSDAQSFFTPSDTLNNRRFNQALIFGTGTYVALSTGLYAAWYAKYPRGRFHLFDDYGEWQHIDKLGHVYSSYFQALLCYKGAKWTGLSENKSMLTGLMCGALFQTTIEVMDGFSSEWGFSLSDVGANIVGLTSFGLQQKYWGEQRITIKVSSIPQRYPQTAILSTDGTNPMALDTRAGDLFGTGYFEKYLKDYNAQTYWASINVNSFLPSGNKWPTWLNVALGYGADNMYGGYRNEWIKNGNTYKLDDSLYPRTAQFYLGFDIDLPRTNPRNPFLKTIFSVFDIFKVPSPAIEVNTQGQFTFHLLR